MHLNELNYEMHCSQWDEVIPVMGKVGMEQKNKTTDCFFSILS